MPSREFVQAAGDDRFLAASGLVVADAAGLGALAQASRWEKNWSCLGARSPSSAPFPFLGGAY